MERLLSVVGRAEGTTTKADLVEQVAHVTDLTKKQAEVIVDSVFDGIIASLRSGEKIELRGFGSFRPYFKPGKRLKELINQATPAAPAAADDRVPGAGPG
jgi:integration host factor subunit beta